MTNLFVTPDDLHLISGVIGSLADDFDAQPTVRYRTDPPQVGDPLLASALAEFQTCSSTALGVIKDDTQALSERLTEAAKAYEECDAQARDALRALLEDE